MRISVDESKLRDELVDGGLLAALAEEAEEVNARWEGNAPSWVVENATTRVRVGVSAKGPFAQAIAQGSGTVASEFGGSRTTATHAMTRAAMGR